MDELRKLIAAEARKRSASFLEDFFERVPSEQWQAEADAKIARERAAAGESTTHDPRAAMAARAAAQRAQAGITTTAGAVGVAASGMKRLGEQIGQRAAASLRARQEPPEQE